MNEKLSDYSDKIKDQSKVIHSRNEIIDIKAEEIIKLNAKCDKCDYMDDRSSIVESLAKGDTALIVSNKDIKEDAAFANLEMMEIQGSRETHLKDHVDLHS